MKHFIFKIAYASLDNKEEALKNLEIAFEYAKKRNQLQMEGKVLTHSSVLVKGYKYDLSKFNYSNELNSLELIKENIQDYKALTKYLNDDDMIKIINKYC